MTPKIPESQQSKPKYLWVGRFLNLFALAMSTVSGLWQAWLLPIVDKLSQQGRLHEGDSDGCFYGMLMVPTIFIVPVIAILAIILGAIGFRLRARTLAVIAWIVALLTLIPMYPVWVKFFGG